MVGLIRPEVADRNVCRTLREVQHLARGKHADLDPRRDVADRLEHAGQDRGRHKIGCGDGNLARDIFRFSLGNHGDQRGRLSHRADMADEITACFGQRQTPDAPLKQRDAKGCLKRSDLSADGRLGRL